jgi:PAS domain S-box-containing protein
MKRWPIRSSTDQRRDTDQAPVAPEPIPRQRALLWAAGVFGALLPLVVVAMLLWQAFLTTQAQTAFTTHQLPLYRAVLMRDVGRLAADPGGALAEVTALTGEAPLLALHDGSTDTLLAGQPFLPAQDAAAISLEAGARSWRLYALPANGWALDQQGLLLGLGLIALLGLAGLAAAQVYTIIYHREFQRQERRARGRAIQEANERFADDTRVYAQVEAALVESEARFRGAFDQARMGMALLDTDGHFLRVNPVLTEMLNYDEMQFLQMQVADLIHPDERAWFRQPVQAIVSGQKAYVEFEQRLLNSAEEIVWVKIALSLVSDSQDNPLYMVAQFDNRTEQKLMEDALWQQILRNEMILQTATDGFCIVSDEGRIIEVNPAFAALLGYPMENLLDTSIQELEVDSDSGSFAAHIEAAAETGSAQFEVFCQHREGQTVELATNMSLVELENLRFFFISARDITANKQAQAALSASEAKARGIVENSLDAIMLIDEDGCLVEWNHGWEVLSGYRKAEVIGRPAGEVQYSILPPERQAAISPEILQNAIAKALNTGQAYNSRQRPFQVMHRDGTIRLIATSEFAIPTARGYMIAGITRDITEREQVADTLRKLSRAVEQSPIAISIIDLDGVVTYTNPHAALLTGLESDAMIGQPLHLIQNDLLPPDVWDVLARGQDWYGELYSQCDANSVSWEFVSFSPIRDNAGQVTHYLVIEQDITPRKAFEQILQESEARFRTLTENSLAGIVIIQDDRFAYTNPAFALTFGYTQDEILAMPDISPLLPGDWEGTVRQSTNQINVDQDTIYYNFEGQRRDGSAVYCEFLGRRMEYQGRPAIIGTLIDLTERRMTEHALQESQRTLSTLMSNLPGMAYRCQPDTDWTMAFVSDGVLPLTGYHPEELIDNQALSYNDLIHPDDRQAVRDAVNQGIANGKPFQMQYRLIDRAQQEKWVWEQGQMVHLPDGSAVLEGFIADVTDRMQAEIALQESRQMLQLILDTIPTRVFWKDLDSVFQGSNRQFAGDAGYDDPAELVGKTDYDMIWQPEADLYRTDDRRVIDSGEATYNLEEPQTRADGVNWLLTNKLPLRDASGTIIGVLGTYEDITERRRQSEALKRAEAQLRQIIDLVPHMISVKDKEGRFIIANQATADAYGTDVEALTGQPDADFNLPQEQIARGRVSDLQAIEHSESVILQEEAFQDASGRIRILQTTKIPFQDSNLPEPGVLAVSVDNTEQKQTEAALRRSEMRYRTLFDDVPIALWEEDFSQIKAIIDELRAQGVDDIRAYLETHPEIVRKCADSLIIIDANRAALALNDMQDKQRLFAEAIEVLKTGGLDSFRNEIATLAEGSRFFNTEQIESTPDGKENYVNIRVAIAPGYEDTWAKVVVSMLDFTDRKRAEEALRESQERFEKAFYDHPTAMLIFNVDTGERVEYNASYMQLLDAPHDLLQSTTIHTLDTQSEPGEDRILEKLAQDGFIRDFPMRIATQTGDRKDILISAGMLDVGEGNLAIITLVDITKRRRVEIALEEGQARYRALFEDVPISLWEEDFSEVKTRIDALRAAGVTDLAAYFDEHPEELDACINSVEVLDVNQLTINLYGASSKEEMLGKLSHTLPEEARESIRKEILALATGNLLFYLESFTITLHGEKRYLAIRMSVAPGYEDTWARVLVSINDITDLKLTQQAEYEQRTLAEALHDSTAAITETLDLEAVLDSILSNVGRVVPHDAANIGLIEGEYVRFHRWHGYDNTHLADTIEDFRLPITTPNYAYMVQTGEPCLISDTEASDMWQYLEETSYIKSYAAAPITAHGQVIGFLNLDSNTPGFFTPAHAERLKSFANQAAVALENAQLYDQIKQHAAELQSRVEARTAELDRERAQLRAILDSMGEGVIYVEDFEAVYANRQLADMLEIEPSELIGDVRNLILDALLDEEDHPALSDLTQYAERLRNDGIWQNDFKVRKQSGETFDANLIVTLVAPMKDDEPVQVVALVRDVSQERALQRQKDTFIANASHELRTPIANMKMRLYLLRRQPTRTADHMLVLDEVTERMETLVTELLDVSRFERGVIKLEREYSSLENLLHNVVDLQQPRVQDKALTLTCDLPDMPIRAYIDNSRINRVITNLVNNAMNYTPEGGAITVRLRQEGQTAFISVEDNGIGIAPEVQEQIFEPFYRVSERVAPGTGLGLTISREIVELHGGTLTVKSEIGKGSTFTIRLGLDGQSIA